MAGGGPDLDSWTAQFQTRDMQRDAPMRLGIMVFIVIFFGGLVVQNFTQVPVPFFVFLFGVLALSAGVMFLAVRRVRRIDEIRTTCEQAERKARKDQELEAFLKSSGASVHEAEL